MSVSKHNRQCSFKTKERYFYANDRFCKYLSKNYGLEKFTNVKSKHLESYVEDMKTRGLASSTIKTDVAGIRFFADKSGNRNNLCDNSKLDIGKRQFGGVDRGWSKNEIDLFKQLCEERNMGYISSIATLARNEGLRLHETLKIDRNDAENAIKLNYIHIIGKGGKKRDVPISSESKEVLEREIQNVERGHKLFVDDDDKTHLVIKRVQNFINRNRVHFQEDSRVVNRTFHGLRHSYAQGEYQDALEAGMNDYEARLKVSKLLGHERDEVTRIYLAN